MAQASEGISESLYWIKHKDSGETYNRATDSLEAIKDALSGFDPSWIASQMLIDADNFGVADADANTERWTPEYITGANEAAADINTTTAGKLYMKINSTGVGAREYAVARELPLQTRYFSVYADASYTWGTVTATAMRGGIMISRGSAYDANNYIRVYKEKSTGVERISYSYNFGAGGDTAAAIVSTTDDAIAFKIDRIGTVFRIYYSLTQGGDAVWVLGAQVEDTADNIDDNPSFYFNIYSVGSAATEDVQVDFDTWRLGNNFGAFVDTIVSGFDSTDVGANEDGSVLERLEQIQEAVNVGTGTSMAANKSIADALGTNGTTVADAAVSVLGAIGANNADNAFASATVVANRDGSVLERTEFIIDEIDSLEETGHEVGDVVIYPVAEDISTAEITDDGTTPALTAQVSQSNISEAAAMAAPAWTEDINFEQAGTIAVISIYFELYWQQRFTVGAGAGTTTSAKWQISGNGGSTWVDVTDNVAENNAAYQDKTRLGVSLPITAITAGANQLQLRLCAWTDDAGGVSTVETKVRSNSYVRLTYRKS